MTDDRIELILRRQRQLSAHGILALVIVACSAALLVALLISDFAAPLRHAGLGL